MASKIDYVTIAKIENGVVVKWTERYPLPEGRYRYEYKEFYTPDLHMAFDKIADIFRSY